MNKQQSTVRITSTTGFVTDLDYEIVLNEVRKVISSTDGAILTDNPGAGEIVARHKSLLSLMGARTAWSFRELDNSFISVEVNGYFADAAVDITGKAHANAERLTGVLVETLGTQYGVALLNPEITLPASPVSRPPRAGTPQASRPAVTPPPYQVVGESAQPQALWGFILAILGILIFGVLTGAPGAILAGIALSKMHRTKNYSGKVLAYWAIGIGFIASIVGSFAFWLIIAASSS